MAFDPKHCAVLSMDLQAGIVSVYVKDLKFIPRLAGLLQQARRAGSTIIHVKVGFRAGIPEASPRNRFLSTVKASPQHQQFFSGKSGEIYPDLAPAEGDLVVTKNRISAFAGTDLDLLLRAHDINTLVMFGIATSGVVLSTFQAAIDADYQVFVIKDCCADLDNDLHTVLVEKHFPRFASVISVGDFQAMLENALGGRQSAGSTA